MATLPGKLGIFIPTIGKRLEYLELAIASIEKSISTLRPKEFFVLVERGHLTDELKRRKKLLKIIDYDSTLPLAEKIDRGLKLLTECDYLTWLGDDDLLAPNSLEEGCLVLDQQPMVSLVFGDCEYIDSVGNPLFLNSSGTLATKLLSWGPDLIPQPGAIWRKKDFDRIGGLDTRYDLAFDFDLFLRLSEVGDLRYVPGIKSYFRWHPGSSSASRRMDSAIEASLVRLRNKSGPKKLLQALLEPAIIFATVAAGKLATFKASRSNFRNRSRTN